YCFLVTNYLYQEVLLLIYLLPNIQIIYFSIIMLSLFDCNHQIALILDNVLLIQMDINLALLETVLLFYFQTDLSIPNQQLYLLNFQQCRQYQNPDVYRVE